MKKLIVGITIFCLVALPVLAGETHEGLLSGIPKDPGEIQLCHLFVLLDNIINFIMFTAMPILAVVYIVMGGFWYVMYIENPANAQKFKNILNSLFWGAIIIYTSWIIINIFLAIVGLKVFDASGQNWFFFSCE